MNKYIMVIAIPFVFLFSGLLGAAELSDLSADQLLAMQQHNALVIDIRTEQEWRETGIIPGSRKLEFFNADGAYDAERWLQQLKTQRQSPDQPVILVCRSGNRSKKVGDFLAQQLDMKQIYHLEHGMLSWIKQGKPTEKACPGLLACNEQ